MVSGVSHEVELLLCSARVHMDAAHAARIRELCGEALDWAWLVETARRHGLDPLLYRHLGRLCPERVPPPVARRLHERYTTNGVRNRYLTAELRNVLAVFDQHAIPTIAYKGPTLAVAAYGDLALRRFADLDLLLRPRDVLRAEAVLVEHGYRPRLDLAPPLKRAFLKSQCELILDRERGRVSVELHWDVLPREFAFAMDQERVWRCAERVALDGAEVLAPAPDDLLLILCAHGTKHFWERLGWVVDVAELLRVRPDLQWTTVLESARRAGGQRMLFLGLLLARDLLGAEVPEDVLVRARRDRVAETLARRAWRWQAGDVPTVPGLGASLAFYVRARERPVDGLRHAFRRAVTPTIEDWQSRRLPGGLSLLYYVSRPFRLAAKHVGREASGAGPADPRSGSISPRARPPSQAR